MDKNKFIRKCAVCGKVQTLTGEWVIDETIDNNKCSHGYCPECFEIELKNIGATPEKIKELMEKIFPNYK